MPDSSKFVNAQLPVNKHTRKAFLAKGSSISRCNTCLLADDFCICSERIPHETSSLATPHLCLLMHKDEAYKPTNTGRLIEHILPDITHRFYWHRTEPDAEFLSLLNDERFLPYIIFPAGRGGYEHRTVERANLNTDKTPLFIILDGSWRQAGRMFRLSKYLQTVPVLALSATRSSEYKLRKAPDDFHLCTAEVAIELLQQHKQPAAANALSVYFKRFNQSYAAFARKEAKLPKASHE